MDTSTQHESTKSLVTERKPLIQSSIKKKTQSRNGSFAIAKHIRKPYPSTSVRAHRNSLEDLVCKIRMVMVSAEELYGEMGEGLHYPPALNLTDYETALLGHEFDSMEAKLDLIRDQMAERAANLPSGAVKRMRETNNDSHYVSTLTDADILADIPTDSDDDEKHLAQKEPRK